MGHIWELNRPSPRLLWGMQMKDVRKAAEDMAFTVPASTAQGAPSALLEATPLRSIPHHCRAASARPAGHLLTAFDQALSQAPQSID